MIFQDVNRSHSDENGPSLDGRDLDKKGGNPLIPLPPGLDKAGAAGIADYIPNQNQRLEWKRYKQYTRNDIMAAIEEVKKGRSRLFMLIREPYRRIPTACY